MNPLQLNKVTKKTSKVQKVEEKGMEIAFAIKLAERGVLTSAAIYPIPDTENSWEMFLEDKTGVWSPLVKWNSEEHKHYKSWRGAILDAERIGLEKVTIMLK